MCFFLWIFAIASRVFVDIIDTAIYVCSTYIYERVIMSKVICIAQPFASLIISGEKRVEVRTWSTRYRGPLFIAATKRPCLDHRRFSHDLPLGAIIGIVDLVDSRPMIPTDASIAFVPFRKNATVFVLANPRKIQNIPIVGRLGIFNMIIDDYIISESDI